MDNRREKKESVGYVVGKIISNGIVGCTKPRRSVLSWKTSKSRVKVIGNDGKRRQPMESVEWTKNCTKKDGLCVERKLESKAMYMTVDTGSTISIVTPNCYGTLRKICRVHNLFQTV